MMKGLDYETHGAVVDGGLVPLHARAKFFRTKRQQKCRRRRILTKKRYRHPCKKLHKNRKGIRPTGKNRAKKKRGERKKRVFLRMMGTEVGGIVGGAMGGSTGPLAVLGMPAGAAIGRLVGGVAGQAADTLFGSAINGFMPPPTSGQPSPPPFGGLSPPQFGGQTSGPPPYDGSPLPPLGGQTPSPPPPPPPPQQQQQATASELNRPPRPPNVPQGRSSVDQGFYLI